MEISDQPLAINKMGGSSSSLKPRACRVQSSLRSVAARIDSLRALLPTHRRVAPCVLQQHNARVGFIGPDADPHFSSEDSGQSIDERRADHNRVLQLTQLDSDETWDVHWCSEALHRSWARSCSVFKSARAREMNGIDRVFVSALNTVKRLPSSPSSPKPPLEDRLLLYGLFKQSMEGDIPQSMLQTLLGEPIDEEDDANREKTDAWAQQCGTTKTEAKKLYITTLIRSMRQYGSKTETARSLIDELEFVWNQVNGNSAEASPIHSRSSSASHPGHNRHQVMDEDEDEGDEAQNAEQIAGDLRPTLPTVYQTAPPSPSKAMQPQRTGDNGRLLNPSSMFLGNNGRSIAGPGEDDKWKRQVEQALQQIRAELASVRESLLHNSPSSSSLYGMHHSQQSFLSLMLVRVHRFLRITATVLAYDVAFLWVVWYFFNRRGDQRAKRLEIWVKNLWNWLLTKAQVRVRTGVRSMNDRR